MTNLNFEKTKPNQHLASTFQDLKDGGEEGREDGDRLHVEGRGDHVGKW